MGLSGLDLLLEAKKETGLPIVTEIMSTDVLDRFERDVDLIQVGARNMQNFALLKALGKTRKPILVETGPGGHRGRVDHERRVYPGRRQR
jgi:3-deoxy-7-phosphoheptulonate synthase